MGHAALALARGSRHDDGPGNRLRGRLARRRHQESELLLPSHERRGLSEQRARHFGVGSSAHERELLALAADLEPCPDKARRHLVDSNAGGARCRHERRRLIDEAPRRPTPDRPPPRGHADASSRKFASQRERARAGGRHLLVGLALPRERDEQGAVRETRELAPVPSDDLSGALLGDARQDGQHHAHGALLAGREARRAPGRPLGDPASGDGYAGQLRGHRGAVVGAERAVLREHPSHEVVEARGELRSKVANAGRLLAQHLREDRHHVDAGERGLPRQTLVEDTAEREDVGAGVEVRLAGGLLRRHVPYGAEHDPGRRDARRDRHGLTGLRACHAEIDEHRAARCPACEADVARLDVAMDEAPRMDDGEPLGDPPHDRDALLDAEAVAREAIGEVLAFQPVHRQVREAVAALAVVQVPHDGRMAELGENAGLLAEACRAGAVACHDLERHGAARCVVTGAVHGAHPAAGCQSLDDVTVGDPLPGNRPRGLAHRAARCTPRRYAVAGRAGVPTPRRRDDRASSLEVERSGSLIEDIEQ